MASRFIVIGVLASIIVVVANASAFSTSYPTPDEAAEAGLIEILGEGWTILGHCDQFPTEIGSWDVCFRGGEVGDRSFQIYAASPGIPDMGSWVGVKLVEDGWIPYDGGSCDLFYCRQTDPTGTVINGWPNGDANGDGKADSLDALRVLHLVAQADDNGETPFSLHGNVDGAGLSSRDASLILQSHAGLIGGLPVRIGSAPDFGDK